MPMQPTMAIWWDMWLKHRRELRIVAMLLLLNAVVVLIAKLLNVEPMMVWPVSMVVLVTGVLYMFVVGTHGLSERERARNPKTRMLTLPMTTYGLLVPLVVFNLLASPLYYAVWQLSTWGFFDLHLSGWGLIALAVAGLCVHALSWLVGRYPFAHVIGMLALLFWIQTLVSMIEAPHLKPYRPAAIGGLFGMGAIAILATWLAIHTQRSQAWPLHKLLSRLQRGTNALSIAPPIKRPFTSHLMGQVWYEWRLFGYLMPGILLVLAVVLFVLAAVDYFVLVPADSALYALLGLVYCICFLSFSVAKPRFRVRSTVLPARLGVLPLSDDDLAASKIRVLAGIWVQCWSLWLIFVVAVWAFLGTPIPESVLPSSLGLSTGQWWLMVISLLLGLQAFTWTVAANILALGLTGHRWAESLFIVGGMLAAFTGFTLLMRFEPQDLPQWLTALQVIAVVGLFAALLLVWWQRRAVQKRAMQPAISLKPALAGAIGLWVAMALLTAPLPLSAPWRFGLLTLLAAMVIAAVLPLWTAPLAIHHNRHR